MVDFQGQVGRNVKEVATGKLVLQKFSFPMTTSICENKFEDDESQIQAIISRLTELHFYSGRLGWTNEMIDIHFKLAWRLNIHVEELQGLPMCTISLFNLIHIHEDIVNCAACDNYIGVQYLKELSSITSKSPTTARELSEP